MHVRRQRSAPTGEEAARTVYPPSRADGDVEIVVVSRRAMVATAVAGEGEEASMGAVVAVVVLLVVDDALDAADVVDAAGDGDGALLLESVLLTSLLEEPLEPLPLYSSATVAGPHLAPLRARHRACAGHWRAPGGVLSLEVTHSSLHRPPFSPCPAGEGERRPSGVGGDKTGRSGEKRRCPAADHLPAPRSPTNAARSLATPRRHPLL